MGNNPYLWYQGDTMDMHALEAKLAEVELAEAMRSMNDSDRSLKAELGMSSVPTLLEIQSHEG